MDNIRNSRRKAVFDVLAEDEGTQPLIGQMVLERLDLVIEPSTRKVIPNPRSPETPMIEIFIATLPNSGHTATRRLPRFGGAIPQPHQGGASYVCKTLGERAVLNRIKNIGGKQ